MQMQVDLVQDTCLTCGIVMFMTSQHVAHLKQTKRGYYCPNGHSQYFSGETEAERLRKQLSNMIGERNRAQSDAAQARTQAQELEKKLKQCKKSKAK